MVASYERGLSLTRSFDGFSNLKPKRFFLFNLVEVALAIAIVGLGITGIISLFPVGIKATNDAIGENYSSFVANRFLGYLARMCNNPAKSYGTSTRDFWEEYISPAPDVEIPDEIPLEADETSATFESSPIEGGIFSSDNPGLYRIKQGSSSYTDFHATIRVWKSQIENMYIYNVNYPAIPYDYAVALNIEISWPVEKPYSIREKKYYRIEIFRQEL